MEELAILEKSEMFPSIRKYLLNQNIKIQEQELLQFRNLLGRIKKGEKPKVATISTGGLSGIILLSSQLNEQYLQERISSLERGISKRKEELGKVI